MTHTVGIYIYDDVEVLDFAGPYEVFTCATRVNRRDNGDDSPAFSVCTIAQTLTPVRARAGLVFTPDYDLVTHPSLDVLVVAGGVVDEQLSRSQVSEWVAMMAGRTPLIASVCTGAFLLARAGLLNNKRVTTHWEDQEALQSMFPATQVLAERRWVDEGNIITSGGISAGIDMSLHIVERLRGRALAERTAQQMEFDWTTNKA
jgi:transcriptional regulator GlxA family with amidase domain